MAQSGSTATIPKWWSGSTHGPSASVLRLSDPLVLFTYSTSTYADMVVMKKKKDYEHYRTSNKCANTWLMCTLLLHRPKEKDSLEVLQKLFGVEHGDEGGGGGWDDDDWCPRSWKHTEHKRLQSGIFISDGPNHSKCRLIEEAVGVLSLNHSQIKTNSLLPWSFLHSHIYKKQSVNVIQVDRYLSSDLVEVWLETLKREEENLVRAV